MHMDDRVLRNQEIKKRIIIYKLWISFSLK